MTTHAAFYRFWECMDPARRREVVGALIDLHCYEIGTDTRLEETACVNLVEIR